MQIDDVKSGMLVSYTDNEGNEVIATVVKRVNNTVIVMVNGRKLYIPVSAITPAQPPAVPEDQVQEQAADCSAQEEPTPEPESSEGVSEEAEPDADIQSSCAPAVYVKDTTEFRWFARVLQHVGDVSKYIYVRVMGISNHGTVFVSEDPEKDDVIEIELEALV